MKNILSGLGFLVMSLFMGNQVFAMGSMLNDVSTDLENPPTYVKLQESRPGKDYRYNPEDAPVQREKYPDIVGQDFAMNCDQAFPIATEVASLMAKWKIIAANVSSKRIEAIASAGIAGIFKDDVVIELRSSEAGCRLEMRSKSRVGKDDFGVNAQRIRDYLEKLNSY